MANQDTGVSAEQLSFDGFEKIPPKLTVFTNGKPNPTAEGCSWSWVAFDKNKEQITADSGVHNKIGMSTNIAKFHALIEALSWLATNEPETPVDVLCDLELAVKCINGDWKASQPEIKMLCRIARHYLSRTKATLLWIPHEQNKAA
jgi:ribonuclease HI